MDDANRHIEEVHANKENVMKKREWEARDKNTVVRGSISRCEQDMQRTEDTEEENLVFQMDI